MKNRLTQLENWFYKEPVQKRLLYLGFVAVFFLIFALNYFFPIYADDMMYSVVKYGESVHLAKNFKEIATFLNLYYFTWGGRVVAHIFAHVLLLFNSLGQDIINSLVFCALVYLSYRISLRNKANNLFVFIFLAISLFYFTPSFLSSSVWKTGSANYLWTITLTLAFIYPYIQSFDAKKRNDSILRAVFFFLFGIVAGWTNENLAPVLFLIALAYMYAIYISQNRKVPRWQIAGIVGVIIGCSLMILAPGNAERAALEGHTGLFSSFGKMGERLPFIVASYRHFMLRPMLLFIAFVLLHHFFAKNEEQKKGVLLQSLLFFVAANISIWLTILAPTFPPRAFMSITVLTMVSIGILYGNIDLRKMIPRIGNVLLLAVLIFYASVDYVTFLKGVYFLDKEMTKREAVIDEVKARGEQDIKFESIHMDYRFEYTDFENYYKDYYNLAVDFVDKLEDEVNLPD